VSLVITVEAIPAEVICNIKVRVTITIIVIPSRGKTPTAVVLIEPNLFRDVTKLKITKIGEEDIAAPIFGIIEGDWRNGLEASFAKTSLIAFTINAGVKVEVTILIKVRCAKRKRIGGAGETAS